MKPYYQHNLITFYNKDCRDMSELPDESVDLIATDPPYGIGMMGKDWDRALPDKRIWEECFRILKPGAFAFVMSIPRADCLSRMTIALEDAGFWVNFSPIFWCFASGFPKAQNIGKAVDKKLGKERKIVGTYKTGYSKSQKECGYRPKEYELKITEPEPLTPQAKALDGSYGGAQFKPAVEVILVAMKPLSEKTFVEQALKNRKGITWLDDGRIPLQGIEEHKTEAKWRPHIYSGGYKGGESKTGELKRYNNQGRFPANLLVSDDVLNDGSIRTSGKMSAGIVRQNRSGYSAPMPESTNMETIGDSGSFSRYFDLDRWFSERVKELPESVQRTFPFLIVPKASKSEKNKGCEDLPPKVANPNYGSGGFSRPTEQPERKIKPRGNYHPTCKPVKLMSYLITLGSREGDTVVDPFIGTGTTAIACRILGRQCTGYEINPDYCKIAKGRLSWCRQRVMELET